MNTNNPILKLRFTGKDISLANFSAKELGGFLVDFQDSVISIARSIYKEDLGEGDDLISLKKIKNESAGYFFHSKHPAVVEAYSVMIQAINKKDLTGLPRTSFAGFKHISKLTKDKKCNAELSYDSGSTNTFATLTSNDKIITPEDVYLNDIKSYYGEITRVGGTEPRVRFKTFGGTTHNADASMELAKYSATRLYQTVKIKAEIKWLPSSSEIDSMKILEIEDFEVHSNENLFGELRNSLGEYSKKYGSDLKGLIND